MYTPQNEQGAVEQPTPARIDGKGAAAHIKKVLGARAVARMTADVTAWLTTHGFTTVVLGGGALRRGVPKDLDLFPPFTAPEREAYLAALNRLTLEAHHEVALALVPVQVCRHAAADLPALLGDFDFAHAQAGVVLRWQDRVGSWTVVEAHATPAFVAAQAVEGTWYVGNKWPLRSLIRLPGVAAKLALTPGEARCLAVQILKEVQRRGFDAVLAEDPLFAARVHETETP